MSGMLTRASLRAFSTNNLKVINNVARQQFTITMHGDEAVLDYDQKGSNITFLHTIVPPLFQGKGAGKLLANYAFKYAEENKLAVLCHCNFLCQYYKSNKAKFSVKVTLDPQEDPVTNIHK